jgi:4-aminobutyrate aminotransferase-like enzyme
VWYHEHLDYEPDIIIFGKKTQLSGIMVNEQHSQTFKKGEITRLDVTWNADVTDMIRCKYIMKAYQKYNILDNVSKMGDYLTQSLSTDEKLSNVRNNGLIIAFDLPDTEKRNNFVNNLFLDGVLCNPTGKRSIRIRPSLSLTMQEAELAIEKIRGNKC